MQFVEGSCSCYTCAFLLKLFEVQTDWKVAEGVEKELVT